MNSGSAIKTHPVLIDVHLRRYDRLGDNNSHRSIIVNLIASRRQPGIVLYADPGLCVFIYGIGNDSQVNLIALRLRHRSYPRLIIQVYSVVGNLHLQNVGLFFPASQYSHTGHLVLVDSALFYNGMFGFADIYPCSLVTENITRGYYDTSLPVNKDSRSSVRMNPAFLDLCRNIPPYPDTCKIIFVQFIVLNQGEIVLRIARYTLHCHAIGQAGL